MNQIFEEIKDFIIRQRWEYEFPLTRELSIQDDLLIYGDDADDFILSFSKEFNVDISQFRIQDYFKDEGDPILSIIVRLFKRNRSKQLKPLTIGHLEKAAIAGYLNDQIVNS